MPATLFLALASRMEEVPRVLDRLETFLAEAALADDLTFRVAVTLDEVVTNP